MILKIVDKNVIKNLDVDIKLIELDNEFFIHTNDEEFLNSDAFQLVNKNDPYFFVSKKYRKNTKSIKVKDIEINDTNLFTIGGPCSVESYEQVDRIASYVKDTNTLALRAGAFKPRTSPYDFQGLQYEGLEIAQEIAQKYDMPLVSELTSIEQVEKYSNMVDVIQIGARNMQNFDLLKAAAKTNKPIILKRGFSATIKEFLCAAEYIICEGNDQIILCERGIRTFEKSYRNTTDLNGIVLLKKISHLPVIIDASHATGISALVSDVALACIAANVNGMIIETHYDPANALSDGAQSLNEQQYRDLVKKANKLNEFIKSQ